MGVGVDGGSKYDSLILVYDESLGSKRAYFLEEDTDAWGGEGEGPQALYFRSKFSLEVGGCHLISQHLIEIQKSG